MSSEIEKREIKIKEEFELALKEEKEDILLSERLLDWNIDNMSKDITPLRLNTIKKMSKKSLIQIILLREISYNTLVCDWEQHVKKNRISDFFLLRINEMKDLQYYKLLQRTASAFIRQFPTKELSFKHTLKNPQENEYPVVKFKINRKMNFCSNCHLPTIIDGFFCLKCQTLEKIKKYN